MMNTAYFLFLHFCKKRSQLFQCGNRHLLLTTLFVFIFQINEAQIPELDTLKMKLRNATHDTTRALIMAQIANIYGFYNTDSALYYGQKTLTLSQNAKYLNGQYLAYHHLVFAYNSVGEYYKSLEVLLAALKIAERLPANRLAAIENLHVLIGFVYRMMGYYEKAIAENSKAMEFSTAAEDSPINLINSYMNASLSYAYLEKFDSAKIFIDLANNIPKYAGYNPQYLHQGIGRVYALLGNYALAEKNFRKAVNDYFSVSQHDNQYFLTGFYIDLASALHKMDKYDSSIAYGLHSMILAQNGNFLNYVLIAAKLLSELYEAKKQPDSVVKYQRLAMEANDSIFNQIQAEAVPVHWVRRRTKAKGNPPCPGKI